MPTMLALKVSIHLNEAHLCLFPSDTDDSFVWRAHGGSEVDSDNESNNSAAVVDTYL